MSWMKALHTINLLLTSIFDAVTNKSCNCKYFTNIQAVPK